MTGTWTYEGNSLKNRRGNKRRGSALWILSLCIILFTQGWQTAIGSTNSAAAETVVLPKSVPDPIEPFNRTVWGFNKGLMSRVIKPTSKVYRAVVPKPARTGIGNFGRNLTYPGRLINNVLQGNWSGARDESCQFLFNSTIGVAGFSDVGTRWKIPKSDADFGQTFGHWGWKPRCFIMLPVYGPSNDRDTLGLAADTAANPLMYISPYRFDANDPLTYFGPYTYFSYGVMYNNLSDTVGEYVRFSQAATDSYSEVQYAWTFARANRAPDFTVRGEQDKASLETLGSVYFNPKDAEFPDRGRTRSVLIPATGRKLKFTFWLQPGKAPVVYIVPGLGSHRLAKGSLALAELVYTNGFSAVVISSPFNSEFMEHASTAAMPAYLPVDGRDAHVALTEIDHHLQKLYPDRLGERALMGYSMGAIQSLFIAAAEGNAPARPPLGKAAEQLIRFDRYVAIHTPVRMAFGISQLDEFYQSPLEWPGAERTDNIENTFLKMAALNKNGSASPTELPFSAVESRFLIGLTFRLTLRDIIFSSQRRSNQGVLKLPIRELRRDPVYQEILQYSYQDYFEKFVIPYYWSHGMDSTAEALEKGGDLRTYEAGLRANPNTRVIVNQNDFLLAGEDLAWLHSVFTPGRLTVFPQGGHLGNLIDPEVQTSILAALSNLKPSPPVTPTSPGR